ncbi:DMT family transporter [Salipiger bermudensis]|uniref:DMT family transporter n=1 Tax=Salipiger bermudensis TaxID=344736 RepID=UPI001C99E489|nr:DMT family transporter [Salipiger bermudensis]MBY6003127.1 DMT family transporter [Salipiger bermudensis]
MLAFSALVAGSFAMGSLAAPHIAPTALNAVRFVLAALILSAVALASGKVSRASLEAPWRYLVLGGLMIAYFVLMFEGLKTAAPVSMSAVFTLTPLMAAGFGWLLMRQRMTSRMALALAVGAVGALWVIFRGDLGALLAFGVGRGEAVYFVGCAAHAVYAPMVRRLNRGEPALVFTLWTNLAGTVLLLIWGWPALMATDWAALPPIVWITIAYTAIAATAATFVLLQFAALRLPSAKVMAYTYLTPSWVILWTLALGQGVPPATMLVGVALTIAALLLLLKDE